MSDSDLAAFRHLLRAFLGLEPLPDDEETAPIRYYEQLGLDLQANLARHNARRNRT